MKILKNRSPFVLIGVGVVVIFLFFVAISNASEGMTDYVSDDLYNLQNDMADVENTGDPYDNWDLINNDIQDLVYDLNHNPVSTTAPMSTTRMQTAAPMPTTMMQTAAPMSTTGMRTTTPMSTTGMRTTTPMPTTMRTTTPMSTTGMRTTTPMSTTGMRTTTAYVPTTTKAKLK